MPRQRGCSKRGRGEYILVGRHLSSVMGSDNLDNNRKCSRSPSLSSASVHQQDNKHTSTGWGCKIEWFDRHGRSLGYSEIIPRVDFFKEPNAELSSWSLQSHPWCSIFRHPVNHPSEAPSSGKPSASTEEDSQCIFEALSTIQHLIFELRSEVFDVKFSSSSWNNAFPWRWT
jgi:hypothetical protein